VFWRDGHRLKLPQFETGETIKQIQHDARDQTARGKVYSFLMMHSLSKWLRGSKLVYGLAIVNQVVNVVMIVASVVALVVVSDPMFYSPDPYDPLWNLVIESATVAYFTVDYIIKVFTAPSWWRFMIRFLSICDALSFMPTYIELIVNATGSSAAIGFLKVLRLFRLFRFARMFKDSILLESVRRAIIMSKDGLILLCAAIAINLLFFSTAIWVAETAQCTFFDGEWHYNVNNNTTPYQSIAVSFYWNIITITTVGYGDVFPITAGGKIVACFAALSGLLMLAFPLTIFSTNFQNVYMELSRKDDPKDEIDFWEKMKQLDSKEGHTQKLLLELSAKMDQWNGLQKTLEEIAQTCKVGKGQM
jgi:voltage-gated potassium channel Kch